METTITWNKSGDDYTAKVDKYELRVWQSGIKTKWFAASVKHLNHWVGFPIANTLEEAKAAAEKAYFEHIKK